MNARQLINQARFFMEIGQDLLRVSNGTEAIEVPLERLPDGKLTEASRGELTTRLEKFIGHKSWQPRARVYCAIGARGVSLRKLSLPSASKDELERLLPFQIEREFPLSPDQLAWGSQLVGAGKGGANHSNGKQEFIVAAVKKELLEEYAGILANCGAAPIFTLAALDRTFVCPQPPGPYAVLALERNYSELITIDAGTPISVRVLPWGRADLLRFVGTGRVPNGETPAKSTELASFGGIGPPSTAVGDSPLDQLAGLMNGQSTPRALYVTGWGTMLDGLEIGTHIPARIGGGMECHKVELPGTGTSSAAMLGLQRAVESQAKRPELVFQLKKARGVSRIPPREQLKWAGVAAGLLLLALLLPYAEALILKPHLVSKLAAIKNDQGRLAVIDRELDFLQYLEASEPPYLDALTVLSKSAPPGTRFDSVSMNRRGEVSLRGSLQNGQQVSDLRSKLIASGFFSVVSVEEQAPSPDKQKVSVRMTAQWKPTGSRISPAVERPGTPVEPKNLSTPPSGTSPAEPANLPLSPKPTVKGGKP